MANKVTSDAALHIAVSLRSVQEGKADAYDAFWAAAFNLGVRELEKDKAVVTFDPQLHQDMEGGLLKGDRVKVIHSGWMLSTGTTLLRAQVKAA